MKYKEMSDDNYYYIPITIAFNKIFNIILSNTFPRVFLSDKMSLSDVYAKIFKLNFLQYYLVTPPF